MVEYIPSYSAPAEHWGLLPATRLASRKILIEQNIKRRTGPALCVFSLLGPWTVVVNSPVNSVYTAPCTHNKPPPRQYSPLSAPSDIFVSYLTICPILSRWFFHAYCLDLHPFYISCLKPPVFMHVNRDFLLPDLQENSGKFSEQDLFAFDGFMRILFTAKSASVRLKAILWIVRLTCLFPFRIVYAWFFHKRSLTGGAHPIL
jgi:hypothetical protein